MLRIWNYNKSRIHCYRGAKDIEIKLDNELIFKGEIARANGEIVSGINGLGDVSVGVDFVEFCTLRDGPDF